MITYKDVVNPEFAKAMHDYAIAIVEGKYGDEPPRVWTNQAWAKDIVRDSAPVLCMRMPQDMAEYFQNELTLKGIFNPETDKPLFGSAMLYVWFKESYIPTHADAIYSKAVTLYLNQNWEYNEGGMFHWFDDLSNEWKAILPSFNTAVVNNSGALHAITPVKSNTQFRVTAQTFIVPLEGSN
jgi:hypothetical protein